MNTYVSFLRIFALFSLFQLVVFPQAGTYYDALNTGSASFVDSLKARVRSPYTKVSYDNFDETNIANFAAVDNGNGTKSVFCVYSSYEFIYSGTFAWGTMSREHTFCHSWMPTHPSTSTNEYSDQHHLFPTHQNNANGRRSNHPLEKVVNINYQFMDGILGTNNAAKTVYEPRQQQKGDAARALLYMMVRYDGISGNTWNFNWLNGTRLPALSEAPQNLDTLLAWHRIDPPDKYEINRNNYIQSIQQNRNPFIDRPEYVNYINFNNLSKLSPSYAAEPSNYVTGFTATPSGSNVTLGWTDATGSQLPTGYFIVVYDNNDYFLPIDGEVYTNDTDLSDGRGRMHVAYSASNEYIFSGLPTGKTYYFTIYSYNGDDAQRNYKVNGTLAQANASVTSSNTTVQFTTAGITAGEGNGTCTLTVSITNPSVTNATTADVVLISGSASDLNNYTTQTVTFPANSSANQTVTVTITDDLLSEGDESFEFELQNISGGTSASAGAVSQFNLTITDNDLTTVQFTQPTASVNENAGTYQLSISITNPSLTTATQCSVVLVSGSAADINNYITQILTFPAGSSANQTVTLTITDDATPEGNESFDFELQNVTGGNFAEAGSPSLFTLTVIDNEALPLVLLDNFNRTNSNTVGSTPTSPTSLAWNETETVSGTGIRIDNNRLTMGSTTSGYEWAYLDMSSVSGYPLILSSASSVVTWAFNIRHTRADPSGFDGGNYGVGFVLAKSTDLRTSGTGYAVVYGQSGSTDLLRLARFSNGLSPNSTYTNIITYSDFGNEYISVKVIYSPFDNQWTMYAESNASAFPQSNPVNVTTLAGTAFDGTYTGSALPYLGALWNHNTAAGEAAIFDDIYTVNPNGALPVELTSFTGAYSGESVVLKWTTETEVNNYGFEVQRRKAGSFAENWEVATFVTGNGNSNSQKSYSYTDRTARGENYLYRLRQIDTDGSFEYSPVIEVRGYTPDQFTVKQNYPNPFNPATVIRYFLPEQAEVIFTVYNSIGAVVHQEYIQQTEAGWHEKIFNGAGLSSGSYFYEVHSGGKAYRGKMLLLK